jgi:hypothetical protein
MTDKKDLDKETVNKKQYRLEDKFLKLDFASDEEFEIAVFELRSMQDLKPEEHFDTIFFATMNPITLKKYWKLIKKHRLERVANYDDNIWESVNRECESLSVFEKLGD